MHFLKAVRILHGLKQKELAQKVGRSQPWLSRVENGELLPQRREVEKIAKELKNDLASFF